jgi:hypothetical protein
MPDMNNPIGPSSGKPGAVGAKGQARDAAGPARGESPKLASAGDRPQPYLTSPAHPVATARGQYAAIRAERHGHNRLGVLKEGHGVFTGAGGLWWLGLRR